MSQWSLGTRLRSFGYAFVGIASSYRHGVNIRIQSAIGLIAIILGFVFQISLPEWLAIIICIGLVIGAECINTAIEAIVDRVSLDLHPLSKLAKDAAAGGVLVFSIMSFVVALVIFLPPLLALLGWA